MLLGRMGDILRLVGWSVFAFVVFIWVGMLFLFGVGLGVPWSGVFVVGVWRGGH